MHEGTGSTSKAYVLNLESQPENFRRVREGWAPFGFECMREIGSPGTPAHVACTKSHLGLVSRASGNGDEHVLVFEDDCTPCAHAEHWLSVWRYLKIHRDKWDLFYGGATMVSPSKWICGFRDSPVSIVECSHALSTHFVIYNASSFAPALRWFELEEAENARPAIDTWLTATGLRIWTTVPALAVQRPSWSNTLNRMVDYSDHFERADSKLRFFVELRRSSWTYWLLGSKLQAF